MTSVVTTIVLTKKVGPTPETSKHNNNLVRGEVIIKVQKYIHSKPYKLVLGNVFRTRSHILRLRRNRLSSRVGLDMLRI